MKTNTWQTKENIINKKVLPYFGNKRMSEIGAKDIIQWQNEMMRIRTKDGKPLSATYLKTLHNQVSAIFNYAVRFYDLKSNPAAGRKRRQEGGQGDAVLDERRILEIRRSHDGQAHIVLRL
jgi:hypothetical protein